MQFCSRVDLPISKHATDDGLWAALVTSAPDDYLLVLFTEGSDSVDKMPSTRFEQLSSALVAHTADIIVYHIAEGESRDVVALGPDTEPLQNIFRARAVLVRPRTTETGLARPYCHSRTQSITVRGRQQLGAAEQCRYTTQCLTVGR